MMNAFRDKQVKEYQQHLDKVNLLHSATSIQYNIKRHRMIPKHYLLPAYLNSPHNGGAALTQSLNKKYNDLFFQNISRKLSPRTQ